MAIENKQIYFSPEFLETLKRQIYMSDETWHKVISADPTGWRAMLEDKNETN